MKINYSYMVKVLAQGLNMFVNSFVLAAPAIMLIALLNGTNVDINNAIKTLSETSKEQLTEVWFSIGLVVAMLLPIIRLGVKMFKSAPKLEYFQIATALDANKKYSEDFKSISHGVKLDNEMYFFDRKIDFREAKELMLFFDEVKQKEF